MQLPSRARFDLGHFLYGVTNMNHDEIARMQRLALHEKQVYIALNAVGIATCEVTGDGQYLHGNAETHTV